MKKDKLFDVIVYKFLLSMPVSCVANFVYGFALFIAIFISSNLSDIFGYVWVSIVAILPFILYNTIRYLAIKSGHLRYGITGLIISSVPEYLFIIIWGVLGV